MAIDFYLKNKRMEIDCNCGVCITFLKSDVTPHIFNLGRMAMPRRAEVVICPACKRKNDVKMAKEYKDGTYP